MLGATLFGAGAIFASPQVASAKEVADGGLPPGIAEYMGVIKSKKQWNQIGKRVSEGKDDIPKEEWQNIQVGISFRMFGLLRRFAEIYSLLSGWCHVLIYGVCDQGFLRKFYDTGKDMESVRV